MADFAALRALDDGALLAALRALFAPGAPEPDVAALTAALRGRTLLAPVPGGAVPVDLGDWTALLIVRLGAWEPHLAALARRLLPAGGIAVDVGAHIGTWTLLLAHAVGPAGRVVAYEPGPDNVRRARQATAGLGQVTLVAAAVGERAGRAGLHGYAGGPRFPGADGMLWSLTQGPGYGPATLEVDVVRLDDAGLAAVDFVKLDTEGAELAVLRGARALLARSPHASLLIELHAEELAAQGLAAADVTAELAAQGFAVFDLCPEGANLAVRPLAAGALPTTHHLLARRDPTPFVVPLV